jgi:carotenoid 1,2-hydratase
VATSAEITTGVEKFRPSSSIAEDVWHGAAPLPAYEWWYFDALSHDGRDALVIIFLSNFIFSPRYNRTAAAQSLKAHSSNSAAQFPAVAICCYRDNRPLFRAINEYAPDDFWASATRPEGRIGHNTFRLVETGSELRYQLNIKTALRRRRELRASLEWTIREGDFFAAEKASLPDASAHYWNMVAPRCDVAGEITVIEDKGERSFEHNFQGTGYHDHNRDTRWMPATIAEWQWGRIHFPAATAVFYRTRERDERQPTARLYLIRDSLLSSFTPRLTISRTRRHLFGLSYPSRLKLQAATENLTLNVRQQRIIDSSFFYLRFLSHATLETADGQTQQATGITEHLAPRALSYPWLHWLINMRIGHDGHTAFLP